MRTLNPSLGNCRRNGVMGLGLMMPSQGPSTINIKVSHGHTQYEVFVPFSSSFGYLKSFICQQIGLRPEGHKLLFRGRDREEDEDLQAAGVTDYCEVLLVEAEACDQGRPEEILKTNVLSKGEEAVAEVRKEVNKLTQQVSSLQALVDRGIKVDDKEIVYLTEMFMRQLLKLDGIEAEGEGRVQRRAEVRRVQSIVDALDALKSRNSNLFSERSVGYQSQREYNNSTLHSSDSFWMPSSSKI